MQRQTDPERQIDFVWLYYAAMNKLRFSYREARMLSLGEWLDYFETFKGQYNFEMKRGLYDIKNKDTIESLDSI